MDERIANDSSPFELAEKGLFAPAAEAIDARGDSALSLRVLRAELDAHITSPTVARSSAELLLRQELSHKERAICWALVGHAALKSGELQHGLRAMNLAIDSAALSGDPAVEAKIRDRFISSLLNSVSVEAACIEMPNLRQLAVRAGDGRSMATFHILAGSINARRGHYPSALTHLEIGRELLNRFENEWLRGRLAIVYAATALMQSDYVAAISHIETAQGAARRSGSRELLIPATGNFAILTLAGRRFAQARQLLDELLVEVRKSGSVTTELNVQSHNLQLAIAEGNLTNAKAVDEAASLLISKAEGVTPDQSWFLIDRARWLFAKGDASAGLAVAMGALQHIQRASDINLWRRMKLIAAEGMGRLGRPFEGATLVHDVITGPPYCPIDIVAETFRVTGHLAANDDVGEARRHFEQAALIFEGIGNLTASDEARRHLRESADRSASSPHFKHQIANESNWFEQSDQVVSILQMGTSAPLLARELLSKAAASELFLAVAALEIDGDGNRKALRASGALEPEGTAANVNTIRIPLGARGRSSYELVAVPKPTTAAMTALLSMRRLAQMATSLSRASQIERESVALLPIESPTKQLGLICNSDRMRELLTSVRQVADADVTVLITGETGVGKELFARALHLASARSNRTFLPFNCSTTQREMIDSQLFGHRRGSFTGAISDSLGVVRAAAGGTLFLDEIGEMALETQPKLLRFLESREILPLGETKPVQVDVRVVAATNANLDQLVADGRFREDLYYRLNVIRINIPPLRERREEIPALVEYFLDRFGTELQKPLVRIADETLEYLVLYGWPGNVRQLANEIRRLVAMAEPGAVIMPAHLANEIFESRRTLPANRSPRLFDEVVTRIDQPLTAAVEHIERAAIQRALAVTDGHLDEAARILGLSRKGLYLKRQRLNLG